MKLTPRVRKATVFLEDDTQFSDNFVRVLNKPQRPSSPAGKVAKKRKQSKRYSVARNTQIAAASPAGSSASQVAEARLARSTLSHDEKHMSHAVAESGVLTHRWEFALKRGGYSAYSLRASHELEKAYSDWLMNPHVDVRSVHQGDWEVFLDFHCMEQQNISAKDRKTRKIRRVMI
jgi:hypothetical protein